MSTGVPAFGAQSPADGPRWLADAELVVVGSGVAGLTAAVHAVELGLRVALVTKAAVADSNTRWAQGGVAVVRPDERDPDDTVERHVATVRSGWSTRAVTQPAPRSNGRWRPMRCRAVCRCWSDMPPSTCCGRRTVRSAAWGCLTIRAGPVCCGRQPCCWPPAVSGQLYQATSNPEIATGDGLALALRAGAQAADLEFVQFHPTVLYIAGARGRCPLVTEAVRGEGAVLIDVSGARVMDGVHPMGDLAPRDVVSAAITRRMVAAPGGVDDHVFLDATGLAGFAKRFPTVHASCLAAGVDPAREPIPVTPAAHFACGGVLTSTEGRSTVTGLYAAGEVARTGMHGANRLASSALLAPARGWTPSFRCSTASRSRAGWIPCAPSRTRR